jgi:hypothetical protein
MRYWPLFRNTDKQCSTRKQNVLHLIVEPKPRVLTRVAVGSSGEGFGVQVAIDNVEGRMLPIGIRQMQSGPKHFSSATL